jgi:hypothetical protein
VLGTSSAVALYYLGVGFAALLAWGIASPDRALDADTVRRYQRWAPAAAALGVLHPGLALAARDVLSQVALDVPADDTALAARHARARRLVDALLVLSGAVTAAAVVTIVR